MSTTEIKKTFNGLPIKQNFSNQVLGVPSIIVQHNWPTYFQFSSHFSTDLAYTSTYCVAVFRVRAKK